MTKWKLVYYYSAEYEKYINFVLPKQTGEINFEGILTKIFGNGTSLFNAQWNYLNLVKCDDDGFVTYAGTVNWEYEKFKLNELTSDLFKCLKLVQDLTSNKDTEIRSRILTKLEMDLKLTLKNRRMSA